MLPVADGCADLVTCIELLEHLAPFDPAVAELARITGGRCVVSVPWEPWFRLGNLGRGKNVRRLGNDPEHVQAFTPGRLRRALERHFAEVRVVKAFPWLIAEAAAARADARRCSLGLGRDALRAALWPAARARPGSGRGPRVGAQVVEEHAAVGADDGVDAELLAEGGLQLRALVDVAVEVDLQAAEPEAGERRERVDDAVGVAHLHPLPVGVRVGP